MLPSDEPLGPSLGDTLVPSLDDALVLALDQGGQSSRALVFDARGSVVAKAARTVGERREGDDRVEQDGEELVRSLRECVDEVARALGADARRLACAGLATQRSSIACWDRTTGAALAPVLSWQDRRAAAELARFTHVEEDVIARTGLRLSPHYGASKLAWCLAHVDAVRAARANGTLALGPLASFLAHRLLEERPLGADPANASRTLLWNLATGDWDDELCVLFGVPRALLPPCAPTRSAFGTLAIGSQRVPFTLLNGDQSCALFAAGPPDPDALHVNLGTGAFVQRPVLGEPPRIEGLLASVVLGERDRRTCVVEGTINGAGSALAHHARELGIEAWEPVLERALATERDPPLFQNGHSGLAAPFWRSDFRSRFVGEGAPEAKLAAVAESIVFLGRAIVERMDACLPRARRVIASGGLSRSAALVQRLADVLELEVERRDDPEATARGLARLLFDGLGHTRPFDAPPATRALPDPASPALLRYRNWRTELERALAGSSAR